MHSLSFIICLAISLCASVAAVYVLYRIGKRIRRNVYSPLGMLPGPPFVSYMFGSFDLVPEADAYRLFERWSSIWGSTFKYYTVLGIKRLHTTDLRALNHILNSEVYQKSNILVRFSPAFRAGNLGSGLLFVQGERHKELRKIMNEAFSLTHTRTFCRLFLDKATELCDIWDADLSASRRIDGKLDVDVLHWLSRLSLDTIGLVGFDYAFDSLSSDIDECAYDGKGGPSDLLKATRDLFTFDFLKPIYLVQLFFPLARIIPTEHSRTCTRSVEVIHNIGVKMVADRKRRILAELGDGSSLVAKKSFQDHDLLSLLIRASVAADIPSSERMSDEEIVSQIPSMLLAGHETTAVSVSWTLFSLAMSKDVQSKLRAEVMDCPTPFPSMEELNALVYLDAVVRESMRVHAPVGFTERVATQPDLIPLETPYADLAGNTHSTVRVEKGDKVFIPIRAMNRSPELWGTDAESFKPERWLENGVPSAVRGIPSVWSNTMSFLSGPHACIGYRVALLQMKTMLFVLIRAYQFELAISPEDVGRRNNIVGRPYVCSDPAAGTQLRLLISAAR